MPAEVRVMVSRIRWRGIREFLADMPSTHCTAKPDHSFCTVCMRINYIIAHDCPLFHQKPKRRPRRSHVHDDEKHEAVKDHLTSDDVKHALKGEDFPIIEFAKPRILDEHEEEEEILDVEPIDVRPLEGIPPKPKRKSVRVPSPRTDEEETKHPEARAATPEPSSSIPDPEMVVQEIMDEFTFPSEDEEEEPEEEEEPDQEDAGERAEGEEGAMEEGEEESPPEGEESPKEPPRVEKQAVRKRIPKTDQADPD